MSELEYSQKLKSYFEQKKSYITAYSIMCAYLKTVNGDLKEEDKLKPFEKLSTGSTIPDRINNYLDKYMMFDDYYDMYLDEIKKTENKKVDQNIERELRDMMSKYESTPESIKCFFENQCKEEYFKNSLVLDASNYFDTCMMKEQIKTHTKTQNKDLRWSLALKRYLKVKKRHSLVYQAMVHYCSQVNSHDINPKLPEGKLIEDLDENTQNQINESIQNLSEYLMKSSFESLYRYYEKVVKSVNNQDLSAQEESLMNKINNYPTTPESIKEFFKKGCNVLYYTTELLDDAKDYYDDCILFALES